MEAVSWTFLYLLSPPILCKRQQCSSLPTSVIPHQAGEGIGAGKHCEIVASVNSEWLMDQVVFVPCLFNIECRSEFYFRVVLLQIAYLFICIHLGTLYSFTIAASRKRGSRVAMRMAIRYTNWQSRYSQSLVCHLVKASVLEDSFPKSFFGWGTSLLLSLKAQEL